MSAEDLLAQTRKTKRVRPTAAAVSSKTGDDAITRDVPKSERKSHQEILEIGLRSANPDQTNKDRWRQAPYVWNEKDFLYEPYYCAPVRVLKIDLCVLDMGWHTKEAVVEIWMSENGMFQDAPYSRNDVGKKNIDCLGLRNRHFFRYLLECLWNQPIDFERWIGG